MCVLVLLDTFVVVAEILLELNAMRSQTLALLILRPSLHLFTCLTNGVITVICKHLLE